jgi:gamma-glutamylaminecyclotransferase
VWLDTFEVSYHKSKDYKILDTDRPYICHFRYATIGKVNRSNTHPFVCGNNKNELLMMNGSIYGMGNNKVCDTKVLSNKLGTINRHLWKKELSQYEHRFVSINTRTRTFQIYNKELWTRKDGVWFSKDNVLRDNLICVYGTLKKDYSNYHRHLKGSKYIGNGNTLDKYPLLIEGLPYMVNKKGTGHNVEVDVFKVSNTTLKNIDNLEGHPDWYKRIQIPILINGKTLNCWIYFNDRTITKSSTLHKTYTQSYSSFGYGYNSVWGNYPKIRNKSIVGKVKSYTPKKFDWSQCSFNFDDDDMGIDTFREHEVLREEDEFLNTTPYCVNCYSDLEFDGFSNYHCNGCDSWFTQNEVLIDSI